MRKRKDNFSDFLRKENLSQLSLLVAFEVGKMKGVQRSNRNKKEREEEACKTKFERK